MENFEFSEVKDKYFFFQLLPEFLYVHFLFNINDPQLSVSIAQFSSDLKMNLTHPAANPDTLFLYNWKPQWSNINSVIITNNDHSLMKGDNSALGRYLMDVTVLVAWSWASSLPFMFVHPYLVVQTKLGGGGGHPPVWGGRPAYQCCAWPGTPKPAWPKVSFPLEWGKKQVCFYPCMKKLAFFCIIYELEHCFQSTGVLFNLVFQLLSAMGCSLCELSNWKESVMCFQNCSEKQWG